VTEQAAALKRFALLVDFCDEDREELFSLLEEKTLVAGRSLFREGSEAESLVLLRSGTVQLKSARAGDLGRAGEGTALGALSLVCVGPREATAIAETPCELLLLPRTSFRRLVEDAPRTACRLAEAILRDLATLVRPGLDRLATGIEESLPTSESGPRRVDPKATDA